jgi:hypothetical protein
VIGLSLGACWAAVLTNRIQPLRGGRICEGITARITPSCGFTVVIAIFFVILNLIVDISYASLTPDPAGLGPPWMRCNIPADIGVPPNQLLAGGARRLFRRKSAIWAWFYCLTAQWLAPYSPRVDAGRASPPASESGHPPASMRWLPINRSISLARTATSVTSTAAFSTVRG